MIKRSILSGVKSLPAFLVIFTTLSLNFSCSKDAKVEPAAYSDNLENERSLIKWGQTMNGRWIPYLFNKIKKENPNLQTNDISQILTKYLRILNNANAVYKDEFISGEGIKLELFVKMQDSIYQDNYEKINNKLDELGMMDALWKHYKFIEQKKIAKYGSSRGTKMLSTNDPPGAVACELPDM